MADAPGPERPSRFYLPLGFVIAGEAEAPDNVMV